MAYLSRSRRSNCPRTSGCACTSSRWEARTSGRGSPRSSNSSERSSPNAAISRTARAISRPTGGAMSDTVVDSSVVAKWVLPEPDSGQAQRLISEVAMKGERLIVLDLAFPEVANAIWKRYYRGVAPLAEARQFLDELLRSP